MPILKDKLALYNPNTPVTLTPDGSNSLATIKTLCDTYSTFSPDTYTSSIPNGVYNTVIQLLHIWLQKAIEAREAAVTYYREAKEVELEVEVVVNEVVTEEE